MIFKEEERTSNNQACYSGFERHSAYLCFQHRYNSNTNHLFSCILGQEIHRKEETEMNKEECTGETWQPYAGYAVNTYN